MMDSKQCLWRYAMVNGRKTDIIDAASGDKGICQLCNNLLVARKGEIRAPHWWHKNGRKCDSWYEPKGPWHKFWQDKFPEDCREIPRRDGDIKHIADIFLPNSGYVIECQYSSMSPEKAREREEFYGKMFWIVNGTRLKHDQEAGKIIKEQFKYREYSVWNNYGYCVVKKSILELSRVWRDRRTLVFFDFDGTFRNPSPETDVFCLLPDSIDLGFSMERIVVKLSQSDLVAVLNEPTAFLSQLRQIEFNYSKSDSCKTSHQRFAETSQILAATRDKCEEHAREVEYKRELARLQRLADKTGRNLDDLQFEKQHPPLYAITCEWLDLWLCLQGHVRYLPCSSLSAEFSLVGTIALHNRRGCENFWQKRLDIISKFRLPNEGKGTPPSEKVCIRHMGAITALARYEIKENEGQRVLFLSDIRNLRRADGQGHSVKDLCDRTGIWILPEDVAKVLKDEQDIILGNIEPPTVGQNTKHGFSKTPSCLKCGMKMIKRTRNSDGSLFWGCSRFPVCRWSLPVSCPWCGEEIREVNGPYGSFFGCSNYPSCKWKKFK